MPVKSWEIIMLTNIIVCNGEMSGKIVGGEYAKIAQFPHSVYLAVSCRDSGWGCGSSVLTDRLLLTAAHCLDDCAGKIKIDCYAGTADIARANHIRRVKKYIIHERYDPHSAFSDIGLAMLTNPLILGRLVKRVIIKGSFPREADALMAGWGDISDDGAETFKLKKVRQIVRSSSTCGTHMTLLWGMMCASSGTSNDYPAVGDSGSALIRPDFQQIGIVSMKLHGVKVSLVVYSNVSFFYNWIVKNSALLYCSPSSSRSNKNKGKKRR